MAGPWRGQFLFGGGDLGFRGVFYGEILLPVGPIAIFDTHGDGCADGLSVMDASENIGAIFFDFLAAAAAVAELAAVQLVIDEGDVDGQTRGQAGDEGQQGLSVRFTGGVKAQHLLELTSCQESWVRENRKCNGRMVLCLISGG